MILVTPKAAAKLLVQQIGLKIFADDTLQMKIRFEKRKKSSRNFQVDLIRIILEKLLCMNRLIDWLCLALNKLTSLGSEKYELTGTL